MPRDKAPIDPLTAKRSRVAIAGEVLKRADRELLLRPAATVAPLVRDMRNLLQTFIVDAQHELLEHQKASEAPTPPLVAARASARHHGQQRSDLPAVGGLDGRVQSPAGTTGEGKWAPRES